MKPMTKFAAWALLLFAACPLRAQFSPPAPVRYVTTDPTGVSCSGNAKVEVRGPGGTPSAGDTFTCGPAGTYVKIGGSGSVTLAGDVTGASGANTVVGINNVLLSGLATGVLKITTATGAPSIANAADILAAWSGTKNSTTVAGGDGTMLTLCATFTCVASGTNTTAAMVVGAGGSLATTSTGTIAATSVNGFTAGVGGLTGPASAMTVLSAANPKTTTYQALTSDFTAVPCQVITTASASFTITLVASTSQPASGQCLDVLNYGTGLITVARSGQNINGATANMFINPASAAGPSWLHVVSDGSNYWATGGNTMNGTIIDLWNSTKRITLDATIPGIVGESSTMFAWTSSSDSHGTRDTTLCRQGAGVVEAGAGTGCGAGGTFRGLYQSSDGTAGATVTTCTGYKNGLCISGT